MDICPLGRHNSNLSWNTFLCNNQALLRDVHIEIQKESICSASSLTSRFIFTLKYKSVTNRDGVSWCGQKEMHERRNWACWAHTGNRTLNFACLPIQRRKPSHRGASLCQGELPCQLKQMPVSQTDRIRCHLFNAKIQSSTLTKPKHAAH